MEQQLLDVPETAALLHLRESTIRAWILNRRIPYVKMGRRVFIRLHDARALINTVIPAIPPAMQAQSIAQ